MYLERIFNIYVLKEFDINLQQLLYHKTKHK